MKTLIQTLLVAVSFALITNTAVIAQTQPTNDKAPASFQSGVYTTAEGKLNIALDKQTGNAVTIRLTDRQAKVLLTEYISKRQKAVRLRVDLNALPDGVYLVEITNGVSTTTHAVTLATQIPSVPSRLVALN